MNFRTLNFRTRESGNTKQTSPCRTVQKMPSSKEMIEGLLQRTYEKLPFALPSTLAGKQIADREAKFAAGLSNTSAEPTTARRRISPPSEIPSKPIEVVKKLVPVRPLKAKRKKP